MAPPPRVMPPLVALPRRVLARALLVAQLLHPSGWGRGGAPAAVHGELVPGPWSDRALPPAARARLLLGNLTLDEKLSLLHGDCKGYVFTACGIPRLGIPNVNGNDGPQGFRGPTPTATAWPSGLAIGASFDVEAARAWGGAMGREFLEKGANSRGPLSH